MEIQLKKIKPNPNNPRKNFKGIKELAEDIKKNGLLNKILVRPVKDGYEIVHGERRFKALQLLRRNNLDCEVRELTKEEAQKIALAENIQREDLSVIELANELKRRLETTTQQELSKEINKSQAFISKTLSFLNLIYYAKAHLNIGNITQEHGRELLRFQKYLKMLGYDKSEGEYEFEGRTHQNSIMNSLVSDMVDWIICEQMDSKELAEIVDINIFEKIRYEMKEKGEEIEIDGYKFVKEKPEMEITEQNCDLLIWMIKKSMEWCNHSFIKENFNGDKIEEYCEKCGMVRYPKNQNGNKGLIQIKG